MLKKIVFKNLVHFKDKTFIDFENYPKKQKRKAKDKTIIGSENIAKKQKRKAPEEKVDPSTGDDRKAVTSEVVGEDGRDVDQQTTSLETVSDNVKAGVESPAAPEAFSEDINELNESNLNVFVGANFCGKSTVLELIRRCLSDNINLSVTNSFDSQKIAYVFCEYELDSDRIIAGFIKEPLQNDIPQQDAKLKHELPQGENPNDIKSQNESKDEKSMGEIFKIFCHRKDKEVYLSWKKREETDEKTFKILFDEEKEWFSSLFNKLDCDDKPINQILSKIKQQNKSVPKLLSWEDIEKKYVATFPLRGIGIVQWTKSDKIPDKSNYQKACERAEILSLLLFNEKIDKTKEKEIFDFITHPLVFEFKKENEQIWVETKGETTTKTFELLKTSEGIMEAKITSLLLAHRDFKTICLEDPDRGMHPHMIERLKTVLYVNGFDKTIIVVTHSPYFVDTITIRKTHVFFKKSPSDPYVCSVINAGKSKDLSYVDGMDTLRSLLLASKVLLVEGATDREVVQAIFTHIKSENLEKACKDGISTLDADITTYQIIPIGSCQNLPRVIKFCNFIELPCLCLIDLDYFVKVKDKKIEQFYPKRYETLTNGKELEEYLNKECLNKELSTFLEGDFDKLSSSLEEKKQFVWKGDLEHAILSSKELHVEISSCLGNIFDTSQNDDQKAKKLKEKLKSRLSYEERTAFSSLLMKVKEKDRFINFLKKITEAQRMMGSTEPEIPDRQRNK